MFFGINRANQKWGVNGSFWVIIEGCQLYVTDLFVLRYIDYINRSLIYEHVMKWTINNTLYRENSSKLSVAFIVLRKT